MTDRKPTPPAVKVRLGRATVTIPVEVITAAAAQPGAARLIARMIERKGGV